MNAPFQIQSGVPLPPAPRQNLRYPFADMEIGDCFMVPIGEDDAVILSRRIRVAAAKRKASHGGRYQVRTLHDRGMIGCWRVG